MEDHGVLKGKAAATTLIDSCEQDLFQLSNEIWKNPELAYEEYKAYELLTNFLEKKGFTVECTWQVLFAVN